MINFDIEGIETYKAESVVDSCANLLSLTHCGLYMAIYKGEELKRNGINPESVLIGAMSVTGACSDALGYLIRNDMIEESTTS